MKKRIISLLLIALFSTAIIWASGAQAAGPGAAGTASQGKITPTMTQLGFPLKNQITVKWWAMMNAQESEVMKSFSEKAMFLNLERITNMKFEFEHPSVAANEAFNLLIASGDLPDIVQFNNGWKNLPGGLDGLIKDKVIMDLTPMVNSIMPNFRKLLNDNPMKVDALMKTGEGKYWAFNKIYIDESCWAGPMVRDDIMKKLNLKTPVTMEDWYNMLKTFKANGVQIPLGVQQGPAFNTYGIFIGAYDVIKDYFVGTDNKIYYGPIDENFRKFLVEFNKWYTEGLLDREFATLNNAQYTAKITGGAYGAITGDVATHYAASNATMAKTLPGALLVAVPYPKLTASQTLRFRQQSEATRAFWTCIPPKTKYATEICKLFDYIYSPEGSFLMSYGNEGEAYTLNAQGKPVATELLTKNPLASFAAMATKYCGRNMPILMDQYECYFLDYDNSQTPAKLIWDNSAKYDGLRPGYELSAADTQVVNKIMADVRTYVDEMFFKFIMGQEPLANWSTYVQNIKKMGIDDVLVRHNAAYLKFSGK